jgi:hypothetical protein
MTTLNRPLRAQHIAGLLLFLLTAGCVGTQPAPPREPPPAVVVAPPPVVVVEAPPRTSATQPAPHALSKVPASPAPTAPLQQKATAAPSPRKPEVPPALNLASLEKGLRESEAIGMFTKISLKNQVGDLVDQFRTFHQGQVRPALAELRERYNRLLLKVLSLLQDSDPPLARAIAASREPLWSLLADPAKFATM